MQINFRSLRDTGITWLALAGTDLAKMPRRAGHDEPSTTMGYVKIAEDLTGSIGEPFPALPAELVPSLPSPPPRRGGRSSGARSNWAKLKKRPQRPAKLAERAGVEPQGNVELAETHDGLESTESPRDDVSARTVVEPGPSAKYTQRHADDALKTAIKVAIDVGDLVRATALLKVLRRGSGPRR